MTAPLPGVATSRSCGASAFGVTSADHRGRNPMKAAGFGQVSRLRQNCPPRRMENVKIRLSSCGPGFSWLVHTSRSSAPHDQQAAVQETPSWPYGIHLGIGTAGMIFVVCAVAMFTDHGSVVRLLAVAVAVGFGAALIPDWRYAAALGVIGYLLYLGFLVNQFGELSWSGRNSLADLGVFTFAFLLGLGQRWMRLPASE